MDTPRDQDVRIEQRSVVVGVDGSRIAIDAVRWATAEARLRELPLRIVHAAPYATGSAPGLRRARDIAARAYTVAHRIDPDLPVTTHRTESAAAPSLLDAAQHAELLVVGMGGGDRPHELLIGSVALDVSGRAPCPVAVVRGAHRAPADAPVLVGMDDPVIDATALTVAFADARRHGGRVVVLHAGDDAAPFAAHQPEAEGPTTGDPTDVLAPWTTRFPDVPAEFIVVAGQPTSALLAAATTARLVVLGTRARRAPARALFGSTSRAVLRRSPVPVVVVNPGIVDLDQVPIAAATAPVSTPRPQTDVTDPHDRSELL